MFSLINHFLPNLFITNKRMATLMLVLFVMTLIVLVVFPSAVAFAGPAPSDSY